MSRARSPSEPKSKLCASRLRGERETNVANTFPSSPRWDLSVSLSLSLLSSLFSFSKTAPQPDFSSSISMNRRPILWKERILLTLGAIYPVLASISQDLKRLNAFPPSFSKLQLVFEHTSRRIRRMRSIWLSRHLSGSDSYFRIIEVREFTSIYYRCGIMTDDFLLSNVF